MYGKNDDSLAMLTLIQKHVEGYSRFCVWGVVAGGGVSRETLLRFVFSQ